MSTRFSNHTPQNGVLLRNKTDISPFRRYARFALHPVWQLPCFSLLCYCFMNSYQMVTFVLHSDGSAIALFTLLSVLFPRADTDNFYLLFDLIRNVIDQLFGIFPSETRIGNGFSVNSFTNLLISGFNVTFNHNTFDELLYV